MSAFDIFTLCFCACLSPQLLLCRTEDHHSRLSPCCCCCCYCCPLLLLLLLLFSVAAAAVLFDACMHKLFFFLQFEHFMRNFSEDEGFFREALRIWNKWMARHQRLPFAMARLGCSSFVVGAWAGRAVPLERAVGQEFASALLAALYPSRLEPAMFVVSEREASYREMLAVDLEGADTGSKKDQLTLGLFCFCGVSCFDGRVGALRKLGQGRRGPWGERCVKLSIRFRIRGSAVRVVLPPPLICSDPPAAGGVVFFKVRYVRSQD